MFLTGGENESMSPVNTHKEHVDEVVVGERLQHFADGLSDEFEGEARHAAAPAFQRKMRFTTKKKYITSLKKLKKKGPR